ncbi:MAG: hypothetical protein C4519_19175 [Desulfobacteraceae bacterium]|nr:MAG: hypothetical protein C4519_19175 [Desulfobacteraceae bacterium]
MRKKRVEAPDVDDSRPPKEPEIDHSPKAITLRDQIIFGVKLFAVFGIIFLMFWLYEKYLA